MIWAKRKPQSLSFDTWHAISLAKLGRLRTPEHARRAVGGEDRENDNRDGRGECEEGETKREESNGPA